MKTSNPRRLLQAGRTHGEGIIAGAAYEFPALARTSKVQSSDARTDGGSFGAAIDLSVEKTDHFNQRIPVGRHDHRDEIAGIVFSDSDMARTLPILKFPSTAVWSSICRNPLKQRPGAI